MKTKNRIKTERAIVPAAWHVVGIFAMFCVFTWHAGVVVADEPATTQKSDDPKPADVDAAGVEAKNGVESAGSATDEKPAGKSADDANLEKLKAAARASTQPAKGTDKPAATPAGLGQPTAGAPTTTQPAVIPAGTQANGAQPAHPNRAGGRVNRPSGRAMPTVPKANLTQPVNAHQMNSPADAAGTPAIQPAPGRPGARPDPRAPRTPTTANPRGGTPPASAAPETPGETSDDAAPVVTNTKTKMLVFQIEDPQPETRTYRFQYFDMPWQDVLEDFSRISGLPLVNKPDPPIAGNLTYFSNDDYTFQEAYYKLNELLLLNPLNNYVIQRKPKYLTVERIPDLVRKIDTDRMFNSFEEFEAANLDLYEVCLVKYRTPAGWSAFQVIEQFRSMFSDTYGTEIIGPDLIQLTGLVKEHYEFKSTVAKLTVGKPPTEFDKPQLVYKLRAQKAATVQTILNQLFQIAPAAPRARPGGPVTIDANMQEQKALTIVPDITNNELYVRGPQYLVEEIRATLKRIDVGEWVPPKQELLRLDNASANTIVTTLKPLFQKMLADVNKTQLYVPEEIKAALDVDIFPDVSSNSVIIVGGDEGRARAKQLVRQYDVPAEWVTEIITLQHMKSDDAMQLIQMTLQRLMGSRGAPMAPQVTVQSSNTLLISCSPSDLREVMALLEKIDAPNPEEPHEHIMRLEFAMPSDVAQTVTQVISSVNGGSTPRVMQMQGLNRAVRGRPIQPGKPGQPGQPVQPQMPQVMASGQAGGAGPLLLPDDDAMTLMVYCSDKEWPQVEDLVLKLDAQAGTTKPMLQTIELKRANPEDVAQMINSMFPPTPGSSVPQIVTADIYNNTVQIFATPSFVEQVVPLIETLDINATAELTIIKLDHCKADVIAPILAQGIPGAQAITTARANVPTPGAPQQRQQPVQRPGMVTQRGDTSVRIVAEPVTNSLLVTAPPKELEQIQKLVAEMEKVAEDQYGPDEQVIVTLEHRPAEEISTTLTTLLGSGPTARAGVPGMPTGQAVAGEFNPNAKELKVVSNGDRLILKGPRTRVAEALMIIQRIDVPDQSPETRVYAVNDAENDEQKLRALLAGRVAASGAARPASGRPAPGRPVPGGQPGQAIQQISIPTQTSTDVVIYADLDKNSLLIRALPKDFVEIEELLKVVLSDPPTTTIVGKEGRDSDEFFVIRLKYKSAWDLTFTLDDFINTNERSKVEFLEGPTKRDLIVRNYKPGQEEKIREVAMMFDVPEGGVRKDYRVLSSDKVTSSRLETILKLRDGQTASGIPIEFIRSGKEGRVQVIDIHEGMEPDEVETPPSAPNDSKKNGEPGAQSSGDMKDEHTPVGFAPASSIPGSLPALLLKWQVVTAVAQTQPSDDSAGKSLRFAGTRDVKNPGEVHHDKVSIIQDPETGEYIIVGPEDEIESIISEIEGDEDDSPTVIRVFPLKYTDVNTAAQLLNQVFNQQVAPQPQQQQGRRGQQAGPQQPQGGQPQIDPKTGQPIPGQPQMPQAAAVQQPGLRRGSSGGALLKVVPEERTKSLFVIAKLSDIPLIVEVLRKIDVRVLDSKNIRFFRLKNLEAEQVVERLRDILGLEQPMAAARQRGGRPGQQVPQQGGAEGEQQIVGLPGQSGAATVSADKIKLTAETQTNTVIAQAPPDTLDLIGGLIDELETLTNTTQWDMERFELKNARATDIAEIVDDLARELLPGGGAAAAQMQQQGMPGGGRGARRAGVNRVLVQADSRTNSVIVAGQAKDREVVGKIIKDLDIDAGDNTVQQFTVKGTPSDMVQSLKDLFVSTRGGGPGRGQATDIIITANDATKTILVKAPAPQMAEIQKQIESMDAKIENALALRTIKLAVANAETIATKLTEVFAGQQGRGRAQSEVSFKGVKSNGTLYVRCPDDMFDQIKTIVESMDTAPTDVQVKRFPLKNAAAQDVHQRIQTLMATAVTSRSDLNLDLIGLTPDPRTNSLVLVGGPTSIMLLQSMLSEVDVPPETPLQRTSVSYKLPTGQDVNQVAQNIVAMFQGVNPQSSGVEAPRVTANVAASMVIVDANAEQHKKIKESLIEPILANVGAEPASFNVPLRFARADELKPIIEESMNKWRQARGNKPQDAFYVTADPNSNMLLVNCAPHVKEEFDRKLAEMDTDRIAIQGDRKPKAYIVRYANPQAVQQAISTNFPNRPGMASRDQVTVSLDMNTNTVIVQANDVNQDKVGELVQMMDTEGAEGTAKRDFVYQVKNAQASQLANTLMTQVRATMPNVLGRFPVNVTGDDGSNTLLINATDANFEKVSGWIAQLDVPPQDRITRAFKVKYVAPWTMANIINQQYGTATRNPNERVTAAFEDGTLSIVVTANGKNMDQVAKLIEETDKPGQTKETRYYQIKEARADDLQRALDASLRGRMPVQRSGQYPYNITADLASNMLVATAESQLFEEIEELITKLDIKPAGTDDVLRKNIKLTFADPWAVANSIRQSFTAPNRNPSPRDVVQVAENWTTNSVFVTASTTNMAKIETMIAEMDKAEDTRVQRVIEVTNANPNDVAQAVQAVFQDMYRNRRQQTPPTIKAIPGTTKIIAFANTEEYEQIKSLVEKVDIEGGRIVHTVTMPEQVPARGVSDNINQLFGARGGQSGDGPKAQYHEPTNTVLISATDAEFEKINKQVIQPLSQSPGTKVLNFYKIPLKFAVADDVAQTLQQFFDKKAGISQNRNLPPWMRSQSTSEAQDNQVTVMAEAGSNTLLIFATETTKNLIDELIQDIDVDRITDQTIEMVALQYQDAKEVLEVMTEVLKVQKRTSGSEEDRFIPWWMDGRQEQRQDQAVLAGGMRLKAIESSNSVIVSGKRASVADAVAKIRELDVPTTGDTPVTYTVVNGTATDKAEVLKKLFVEGRDTSRSSATVQKLTIVADEGANQILVKGKTSEVNAVVDMAKHLDKSMDAGSTGVQIVNVPLGQNVETLARDIQDHLNEMERNKAQRMQGYKADLVTITPNTKANVLMVSASKANLEEIRRMIDTIIAKGPQGGVVRTVVPISTKLSQQKVQELIRQMQEGNTGSGSRQGGARRGPRGDAEWTNHRRYERVLEEETTAPAMKTRGRKATVVASTLPVLMMQVAFSTAVAQTTPSKPDDAGKPRVSTIRPRETSTTQPASRGAEARKNLPVTTKGLSVPEAIRASANQPGRPADSQPAAGAPSSADRKPSDHSITANQLFESTTQPGDFANWSDEAKSALQLTGADVTVSEAGPGMIYIEGVQSDVETIERLIRILEAAVPERRIEYFRLKNASASDLAQTLVSVFQKLEVQGQGQAQPQDKVDIIPDSRTNGLYVAASEDKMLLAAQLIRDADIPVDISKRVKAFVFKNRRVSESGEVLKKLIDSYLKQRGLAPSLISVEIDPQTNTAFVAAGESDLEVVSGFVELLDAELPDDADEKGKAGGQGRADIMVVPLRVAKADTLATLLSGLLQRAATGDTPMKDFIRRLRLLDENGNPLATVDLNRPIFVFGDPDSNALLIASTMENCLIMKQVALAFDKEPAKSEVASKVFTLQYADAGEIATRFNEMLTEAENLTKRPGLSETKGVPEGEPGSLVYKAVVKADPRTNQVIIVGRPEAVEVFDGLIKQLDVQGRGVMPFEIVRLEFASPTALAGALTEMLDKRKETIPGANEAVTKSETVIITPDARSQSLIIAAKLERMEELKNLIRQLDVKASALVENIRTITLRKSNANDLAEKLKNLWTQTREQREGGQAGGLGLEIPAIVADERSNSLIVSASLSDFESIKGVVDKIENLELNPMANIYIVRMKYNSASQLSGALSNLFQARAEMSSVSGQVRPEDKVSIEVDETTNSLIVASSRTNYDVLMEKVKELDVEVGVMGQIEFFRCDNVSAGAVKEVVDQLFQDKLFKPGSGGTGQGAEAREKVTTVIDDRANVLVVTASPENMAVIREIHSRMNSVTKPWDVAVMELIQLQHGDCVQVAAQVEDYFDKLKEVRDTGGSTGASSTARWTVKVIADEKRNRVLVGGSKDGIDRAVELIKKLDVPPGESSQVIHVYKTNEAPASKIGEMIKNIFQERNQPRQGSTGTSVPDIKVTVEANDTARTIVVNASKLDHVLIADLIKQLDRPSALIDMVKVFPLLRARASKVKEILDEVYQSAQSGGGGAGAQAVAVVADERTNAIVVAAPPGELSNVETIIGRLDQADITGLVEVGIFPCDNEDAEKMAEILNQIMMAQGAQGGASSAENDNLRPAGSRPIAYRDRTTPGEERLLQTMRENVQITFNVRSNSVIAVAPPETLRLIKELIRKLDGIQKREVLVKVFLLRHADATKIVQILETMFAQDESASQQAEFQQGREMNVEGGISGTSGVPTALSQGGESRKGTFGRPKTTFVADERTNAIIAAGWPEDVNVVADILDQLDSIDVRNRDSFVYTALNMKAVDMQTALDQYFQKEKSVLDSVGDAVSPQQRMERDVSVIAHEESNQLIISTSPRMKSSVLSIVESLDTPPAQVMIQVMIAEVTIDDRFEMGLEFALQELRFSETAVPGGNGILQSSHFDVVGGTDLGAAGSGLGGFSFTITGEDFNFLVRALQSDSRLEVIQRPMIMCQDNQVANITVGQSVPIPQATGQNTGGTVQTNVVYQDVGVILKVEPNINPDGWVYLKVAPEISDIADSSIQVGPGVFAPIFTNRKAETFVAVKDGETVVIGGLITTSESESESKVPLLGDLPLIGAAFRTTVRVKRKTELLLALTPRIVRTVEDGYRMSIEERDKSGIITDEMKASPLFEKLRITPQSEDEISSIEEFPVDDYVAPQDRGTPTQPIKNTPAPPDKKYGPQVPKYGPMVPSDPEDEEVVARRNARSATVGSR